MRFRRLSLDAYGPFTGTTLDLSGATGNGLHLIYGPNEAGKSSALRAIRDLLFGMPAQTQREGGSHGDKASIKMLFGERADYPPEGRRRRREPLPLC